MGRYRRQSRRDKGGFRLSEKKRKFNILEQDLLEAYLRYYHFAATRVCFPPSTSGFDSDEDDDETIRRSNRQATAFENDSTWISGHEFPALVPAVLEQPYLVLPSTLGTSERRTVYEICIHVGLYHTGAGEKFRDRHTVISVHPDGFDHVPHLREPLHFPVSRCKPWFYRNDIAICPTPPRKEAPVRSYNFSQHFLSRNKVRESTRRYRGIIEDLMAHPYQCLREDGVDAVEALSHPELAPKPEFESKSALVLVDSAEKMIACAQELSANDQITELAFDVEAYNASKYKQSTCLLQICTNLRHEYVIDVLAPGVWDEVSLLQPIFANPAVVKIGHGISAIDVPCLHRDFGIFIVNAFDTFEAASKLKLQKCLGLAKLCKYYALGEDADEGEGEGGGKSHAELKALYQMCDWRERPLKDDQIRYSIMDVRYLVQLRRLLIRDILEFDAVPHGNGHHPQNNSKHGNNHNNNNNNNHHNHNNNMISPLKEEQEGVELLQNEHELEHEPSLPGVIGSDSMDFDNDEHYNENGNNEGGTSISNSDISDDCDNRTMLRREESLLDEVDNIHVVEGMLEAKNAYDDSSAFFSAHDDIDGRSQSTMGSKVSELRYNQTFMDVLKTSQQKCLALWTVKTEPAEKNETLLHMKKRASRFTNLDENATKKRRERKLWAKEDERLYKELIEWRADASKKVGVMPSMMCSLDLLVKVAYRRPISLLSLKRLSYFLPKIFCEEDYAHHLEDLFSVVASAGDGTLVNADAVVRLYSERQIKSKLGHVNESSLNEEDASTSAETGAKDDDDDDDDDNPTGNTSCSSSQGHGQPIRAIVLDGEDGEDVSLLDATDTDAPSHTGGIPVAKKFMVATAVVATIAIIGVGMIKKRK